MREIVNPFNLPDNQCFGCSRTNPIGLKLDFFEEGEFIKSLWSPRPDLQGYMNVLHGGIQSALLDEIASWTVNVKAGTAGVTSSMKIRFLKSVFINKGDILLKSRLLDIEGKIAKLQTELYNSSEVLCTDAYIEYYLLPENIARERYWYPGKDAFYNRGK